MDWKSIKTITPEAGHALFWGSTRHDESVAYTGWIARNGMFYSDADGLSCKPKFWCEITPPKKLK